MNFWNWLGKGKFWVLVIILFALVVFLGKFMGGMVGEELGTNDIVDEVMEYSESSIGQCKIQAEFEHNRSLTEECTNRSLVPADCWDIFVVAQTSEEIGRNAGVIRADDVAEISTIDELVDYVFALQKECTCELDNSFINQLQGETDFKKRACTSP